MHAAMAWSRFARGHCFWNRGMPSSCWSCSQTRSATRRGIADGPGLTWRSVGGACSPELATETDVISPSLTVLLSPWITVTVPSASASTVPTWVLSVRALRTSTRNDFKPSRELRSRSSRNPTVRLKALRADRGVPGRVRVFEQRGGGGDHGRVVGIAEQRLEHRDRCEREVVGGNGADPAGVVVERLRVARFCAEDSSGSRYRSPCRGTSFRCCCPDCTSRAQRSTRAFKTGRAALLSHSASSAAIWLADPTRERVGRIGIERAARVDLIRPPGHQLGDARVSLGTERFTAEAWPGAGRELQSSPSR